MTGKIFRYSFVLGVLVLLICSGLFFALQYRQNLDDTERYAAEEAAYIASGVSVGDEAFLKELSSQKDIVWLSQNGTVLYPKQRADLSSEFSRPEVQAANKSGVGSATRNSAQSGKLTYYYAKQMDDHSVIRLALPVYAARNALQTVTPVLWVLILVVAFSGALAFRAAKTIIKPINDMNLDHPEAIHTYSELSPLVARIQEQRLTIDDQIEELHRKQKEFSALTDNMNEGFLLLDRDGIILSVNASAKQHVSDCEPGDSMPADQQNVTSEAARLALSGQRSDRVYSENGHSWQLIAGPVYSHKKIVGAVLLWMDVTEREQRERLRQEFSANISHELKTPLTSISGFAELMANGAVPPEQAGYSASKAALDKVTMDIASKYDGTDVIISLTDPGWCRTDLGGPNAPNSPESSLPGVIVGAFVDDKKSCRCFSAEAFHGMSLEEAVDYAEKNIPYYLGSLD